MAFRPVPNPRFTDYTGRIMKCSIVIRAYNESKHLGRLLQGIGSQRLKDVEVIVVDSGSTDATVQIAESYGARLLHVRADEFTFGRSLNLGIEAATSELIVIASAHVFPVYPDWLERLLSPFDAARVAVVYGKQRGSERSRYSERRIFHQWFPDIDISSQPSPFCNNANAAIRRSLWQRHPYDETLTGLEDIAWAKWAQSQGKDVVYAAHAEVVHVHEETPEGVYDRYRREAMAFKRIFPESHFSVYDCIRLGFMNAKNDVFQAARERILWQHFASILWFRGAQFWGTYQGYRNSSAVTQELRQRFYYPHQPGMPGAKVRSIEPIRYNATTGKDEEIPHDTREA
jgi:glycosyltransferase involved in cell wall biosynthesis